jgi:hypothetical protein
MISGQRYSWAPYDDTIAYMPAMRVLQMRTVRILDQRVPALLRPLIRAYLLGYASSTVPRLLTLFLTHLSSRRKGSEEGKAFWPSLRNTLRVGLHWQRFPTFCAALVGGSILQARDIFQVRNFILTLHSRVPYGACSPAFLVGFQSLHERGKLELFISLMVHTYNHSVCWAESTSRGGSYRVLLWPSAL